MTPRAAVIGAGLMGSGIAGVLARGGSTVTLIDTNKEMLESGLARLAEAQQILIETDRLSADDGDAAYRRISTTTQIEAACGDADLVVEAVSEDLELKQRLFGKLDSVCPDYTILATNTSGLSIFKIADATRRKDRVVGLHFWNPPHVIPLVEVTKGADTSDATAASMMELCRTLGKQPILVRHEIPGFVGNRLQFALLREALHLVAEGVVSPEDVDLAVTAGPGLRYGLLGPLRTADLGGLDVFSAISRYLWPELSTETGAASAMHELVDAGKLGVKTGEGFYEYGEDELKRITAERDRVLLGFLDVIDREVKDE